MLIELAIGDTYGVGFEFARGNYIEKYHDLKTYRDSPIDDLKAGQYSDDTQMSLAITELILSGEPISAHNIVTYFLRVFHRDNRPAYNKGFYDFLCKTQSAEAFLLNIQSKNRKTNGCVMRSVPVGLIKNIETLITFSNVQASTTHDCDIARQSSLCIALAAHFFNYVGSNKDDMQAFVQQYCSLTLDLNKNSRVACEAKDTVDAVFTLLNTQGSLMDILDKGVLLGGDTDSVCAVALGLASLSPSYENNLTDILHQGLERSTYGYDYLQQLDKDITAYKQKEG
jgi:ADP-ribosylglycohydrolase